MLKRILQVQPLNLDTGESDTKDKLSALRTKIVLERCGSQEEDGFVEVEAMAVAGPRAMEYEGASSRSSPEALPEGYVPRAAAGPSLHGPQAPASTGVGKCDL